MADPGGAPTAQVPELSGGTHFPCLDSYRAIGMIMVLLAHTSFATGFFGRSALGPYISRLELAVPMFFMLSGFLLFRPYALAELSGRQRTGPQRFMRRRVLRVFPGYLAALFGIVLIWGAGPLDDAWSWIVNLLLLQQFGVQEPYRITQAWSIGVEISFYLMLPVFGAAMARILAGRPDTERLRGLFLGVLALYLAGTAFRVVVVVAEPSWQDWSRFWMPMYLDFFALGMALGVASAMVKGGHRTPPVLAWLAEHPAISWLIAFGIMMLVAQMDPPDEPFGLNGTEYLPRQFAYGIASVIWLAPAMFGDQSRGRLRAFLSSRTLIYLGAISLSFYLWHLDVIGQAQRWTVEGYEQLTGLAVFSGNFWLVAGIAIVVTFIFAAVAHRLVELPFLRLKDRPLRDLGDVYREALPVPSRRA